MPYFRLRIHLAAHKAEHGVPMRRVDKVKNTLC